VQERPPLVPLAVVPGSTSFTLLGSQDGSAYAVDAHGGGIKWKTPLLPAGSEVQAAPSAFFAAYGAPYGVDFDVVVVGTRNGGGSNRFYALDAATGSVVGTPFDNGGGGTDVGFVSASASLDYPTTRAYFTSRSAGSPNTLWCFDVGAAGLALAWARPAGEIDASPVVRGGVVYTSTIDGEVMAYRADDGSPLWTVGSVPAPFPTEAGGVKGFVFADRSSQALYFSTTGKVWAVRDDGSAPFGLWSSAAVPSPSTLAFVELGGTGYLFVGGGDGRLYQVDAATGTQVRSVQLGGPGDAIGAPTLDVLHSMAYVGSTAGIVYAVEVPLP
jgi:outer membrane protein assembly factor BamB